jgi:hypothetical protein
MIYIETIAWRSIHLSFVGPDIVFDLSGMPVFCKMVWNADDYKFLDIIVDLDSRTTRYFWKTYGKRFAKNVSILVRE